MTQPSIPRATATAPTDPEGWDAVASVLCRSCGMCCDGTLFTQARIETTDRARQLGLEVFTHESALYFHQPCPHYAGSCRVYPHRPAVCANYLCTPMRQLRRSRLSVAEIKALIAETLRIRRHFLRAAAAYPEFAGQGISAMRNVILDGAHAPTSTTDEIRHLRVHLGPLLVIGARLFPLLDRFLAPLDAAAPDAE